MLASTGFGIRTGRGPWRLGELSDLFLEPVVRVRYVRDRFSGPVPLIPAGRTPQQAPHLTRSHTQLSVAGIYTFRTCEQLAISPRLAPRLRVSLCPPLWPTAKACGFGDPRYSNGLVIELEAVMSLPENHRQQTHFGLPNEMRENRATLQYSSMADLISLGEPLPGL